MKKLQRFKPHVWAAAAQLMCDVALTTGYAGGWAEHCCSHGRWRLMWTFSSFDSIAYQWSLIPSALYPSVS
jgi:hypothetical protein